MEEVLSAIERHPLAFFWLMYWIVVGIAAVIGLLYQLAKYLNGEE